MLNEEELKMVEAVVEELREILDPLRHGRPDNPQDQEEFDVVQKALKELGPEGLEELITLEYEYWTLFLGSSKESKKFRKLHEKLKAAHRTRALGWSGMLVKLAVIKHRKYKDRFGRLHDGVSTVGLKTTIDGNRLKSIVGVKCPSGHRTKRRIAQAVVCRELGWRVRATVARQIRRRGNHHPAKREQSPRYEVFVFQASTPDGHVVAVGYQIDPPV